MSQFVIRAINETDNGGIALFWSNEFVWVNELEADIFSSEEMIELNLPIGGVWQKLYN